MHLTCLSLYLVGLFCNVNPVPFENFLPRSTKKCDYKACSLGKPDKLNVHLICHSHDDVGWLKTMDEYFYGAKSHIQTAGVQYIIDTVMRELAVDPDKRFCYCEMAFLSKWYQQQNNYTQNVFRSLVESGQLEIVGAGWSQNDEAITHYSSIIDQMTLGFTFVKNMLGDCGRPSVGWQLDPFGHSKELGSLFAQMGFDGLFWGRLDFQDKQIRKDTKTMEFVLKSSQSLGPSADIFTSVLPNVYWSPSGFSFDQLNQDEPIMDDPSLDEYNVDSFVENFLEIVKKYSEWYNSNHVVVTIGSDFTYQNALMVYKNLDKLIKHVNARQKTKGSNVNLFYSTPGCYINALHHLNKTWPTKTDDAFPLGKNEQAYWTGYYTSRPAAKFLERSANNFLQACKQISALSNYFQHPENPSQDPNVNYLREALGIMQHHDAITGTAKEVVAKDYCQKISRGMSKCEESISIAYSKLITLNSKNPAPIQMFCKFLNASQCNISTDSKKFTLTVYNPFSHGLQTYMHLPVLLKNFSVLAPSGEEIENELIPTSEGVIHLPERKSESSIELVFPVDLPPTGFKTFFITANEDKEAKFPKVTEHNIKKDIVIKNKFISLKFDGTTGLLKEYENVMEEITISVKQSFYYYTSATGDFNGNLQSSGAYIFRPDSKKPTNLGMNVTISVFKGKLVQEVHQKFNNWIYQVVRLRKNDHFAEFDWVVGPIPFDGSSGKEIVTRFDTNLKTNGTFYTDANGREVAKRIRNHRNTYKVTGSSPISSNYYPVTSRIYLKDEQAGIQFSIVTDRSQGGSSILDGSTELMIHRRLLYDDGLGVGEGLNEPGTDGKGLMVRGKHYMLVNSIYEANRESRILAQRTFLGPVLSFTKSSLSPQEWIKDYVAEFSAISKALPKNVHLLSMEQLEGNLNLLIRLEHFFEKGEHPELSKPAVVNLKNLFTGFTVVKSEEMTLGANLKIEELKRFKFKTLGNDLDEINEESRSTLNIELKPMQIRTMFVTLQKKN